MKNRLIVLSLVFNMIATVLLCMPVLSQASTAPQMECDSNLVLNQKNSSLGNNDFIKNAPKEVKKFLIANSVGLLSGVTLGVLSYFTYSPNEALLANNGYGVAGRDMTSPIAGMFSLTRVLTRTLVEPNLDLDYGFYLANMSPTLSSLSYSNLAQQYALGHVIDGAIIGAGIGSIYYIVSSFINIYKKSAWSKKVPKMTISKSRNVN